MTSRIPGPAGDLSIDDGGTGSPAVLFVPSLGGDTGHWMNQLAHLRRRYRAVAIDPRGHGQSEQAHDGAYRIADQASDILAVADHLGLQRFVLVGHSGGALTCLSFADSHPDRLAGLVLIDPGSDPAAFPAEAAQAMLGAMASEAYPQVIEGHWQNILEGSKPGVAERVLFGIRRAPKELVLGFFRDLVNADAVGQLKRLRAPALIVSAPKFEEETSLFKLVPAIPHESVAGTSHWIQLDAPEELNRILGQFLASLQQRT